MQAIARLNMGGPAHVAALLGGRRLDRERFESLLVHGSLAPGEASLAELAEEEGAPTLFLPALQQPVDPRKDARALARLIRLMRAYRPDIVHTHTAKAGFLGRAAALTLRPRPAIVHTYHGHVLEGYFGAAKSGLYLRLERALARVSDRLIGVSAATVDDLVRLGVAPREKFELLRIGLDLGPLAAPDQGAGQALRAELGIGAEDVLAVFAGRLAPIKRPDLLLEALALGRIAKPRLRLAIAGDGELRPELERQAGELGISDSVRFLGYRRELAPLYAAADLAVLSSDNEGTPVALIEAAAAGLPAVATEVGGVAEAVGRDGAMLVPPDDPPAFATALVCLAADAELRARMGAAAQRVAVGRFGAERLLRETEALYRDLAEGVGASPPAPFEDGDAARRGLPASSGGAE